MYLTELIGSNNISQQINFLQKAITSDIFIPLFKYMKSFVGNALQYASIDQKWKNKTYSVYSCSIKGRTFYIGINCQQNESVGKKGFRGITGELPEPRSINEAVLRIHNGERIHCKADKRKSEMLFVLSKSNGGQYNRAEKQFDTMFEFSTEKENVNQLEAYAYAYSLINEKTISGCVLLNVVRTGVNPFDIYVQDEESVYLEDATEIKEYNERKREPIIRNDLFCATYLDPPQFDPVEIMTDRTACKKLWDSNVDLNVYIHVRGIERSKESIMDYVELANSIQYTNSMTGFYFHEHKNVKNVTETTDIIVVLGRIDVYDYCRYKEEGLYVINGYDVLKTVRKHISGFFMEDNRSKFNRYIQHYANNGKVYPGSYQGANHKRFNNEIIEEIEKQIRKDPEIKLLTDGFNPSVKQAKSGKKKPSRKAREGN